MAVFTPTLPAAKWAFGYAATWIALIAVSETSDGAEIAAALAVLIATSAAFAMGPTALKNLGFLQ